MRQTIDITLNSEEEGSEDLLSMRTSMDRGVPRLVVLFHGDLSRIGNVTSPALFEGGESITIGRRSPDFLHPTTTSPPTPLQDPFVSRNQAEFRWNETRRLFEVKPLEGARLKLSRVVFLPSGSIETETIEGLTELEPGSLVAIGKRVLLLADVLPWRSGTTSHMGMVGLSAPMWKLRRTIDAIARFERPVLVLGETGVGKELVSRALHAQGPRSDGPFVPVNCAALPENLVESLLFGHKKGAFTGADQDSPGLFQEASGGCLFLDELGELPMGTQAKLLRAIQEGQITPVGARHNVSVDVRLIAATNRDPENEIQAGNLRQDLFYRLNTHTIDVPRLSARRWDVPLIFMAFLVDNRDRHPELDWMFVSPAPSRLPVPMAFFLRLLRHGWPGNVRELQNIAEQTARLNLQSGTFHLPSGLSSRAMVKAPQEPSQKRGLDEALLKKLSRHLNIARKTLSRLIIPKALSPPISEAGFEAFAERVETHLSERLFELLSATGFNQVQLAEELGVSRTTLLKLMRRFGLPRPQDLSDTQIKAALEAAQGNIEEAANALRVSPRGLRLHMTRSGINS